MDNPPSETPQRHVPVLASRVAGLLGPALANAPDPIYLDGTLGLGGHAGAILALHPGVRLVGVDRDPDALDLAGERLAEYGDRVELVHAVFSELPDVLARLGHAHVHAILLDLGVSSMQLDADERGFAYSRDVALDMRMDPTRGPTAADVLNTYSEHELTRILRTYGEERFAARIAKAIVSARARRPFETSGPLVELLHDAVPKAAQRTGGHPAKRTFQALRIEVNDELGVLRSVVPAAVEALAVGGRLAVLAYHSLEDRLVKRAFADLARPDIPDGVPDVPPGHEAMVRLLTRGAEQATPEEIAANPRAASVRLRAVERLAGGALRTGGTGGRV